MKQNLQELGVEAIDYIAVLFDITHYLEQITHLIKPFGHVGTIVGVNEPLNLSLGKIYQSAWIGSICLRKLIMTTKSKHKVKHWQ